VNSQPVAEDDAVRSTALDEDFPHAISHPNLPPPGPFQRSDQSIDHGRSAALAEHHSVPGGREGLKKSEDGSAGDIWRKVEVHPPGGNERLQLLAVEALLRKLARRLQGKPS